MQGILIVDKPTGWTSFDVIAKLRGVLGTKKLGHSGTLDPMATGVLPVFCGGASKAVDLQENHDKTYCATLRLGARTDTGDITGETLETRPVTAGEAELLAVLPRFLGAQSQIPPMYSAVKVNGVPLYKIARKQRAARAADENAAKTAAQAEKQDKTCAAVSQNGALPEIERTPRPITVYAIEYGGSPAPGDYVLTVSCSKGTYIRTLLEAIAGEMGQLGCMASLRRTKAGTYTEADAHSLEEILAAKQANTLESLLLPVESVFLQLPVLSVDGFVQKHLENGCPTSHYPAADGRYRVHDAAGEFLGLAKIEQGVLHVEKLFCARTPENT
ncbi:MAG: tRNA pseudouridine(55) synthase TruB [Faecalibacterium sp.]|jgi:tRNA pseudouridine55 synthase|nr:tRNA pseudouridine(55) synthase TruB [Faecalibacterium sp.]